MTTVAPSNINVLNIAKVHSDLPTLLLLKLHATPAMHSYKEENITVMISCIMQAPAEAAI